MRSRSHGRPLERWSRARPGCTAATTQTSLIAEFMQLLSGKSISRCVPANDTAGFARVCVSSSSRPPAPPARMRTSVRIRGTLCRVPIQRSSSSFGMPAEEWGTEEFAQRYLSRADGYPRRDEGERALLEFVPGRRRARARPRHRRRAAAVAGAARRHAAASALDVSPPMLRAAGRALRRRPARRAAPARPRRAAARARALRRRSSPRSPSTTSRTTASARSTARSSTRSSRAGCSPTSSTSPRRARG